MNDFLCPHCGSSTWTFAPVCTARKCPHSTDPVERAKHDGPTHHCADGTTRVAVLKPLDGGTILDEAATMAQPPLKPLEFKPHTHCKCVCGYESVIPFGGMKAMGAATQERTALKAANDALHAEREALAKRIAELEAAVAKSRTVTSVSLNNALPVEDAATETKGGDS